MWRGVGIEVEYLSVSKAKVGKEPVVIITIRPDLPSYRPHNIGLHRSQAERLLEDLKDLLSRSTVCLLLVALAGLSGCSGKVEVETQTTSSRPEATAGVLKTEKTRTAVSVDLMRDQGPVLMEDGRTVDVPFDGVLNVHGCLHIHEHLHISLNEDDRNAERVALEIVREWSNVDCGRDRR